MKKSFLFLILSTVFFFCFDAAAACRSKRTVRRSTSVAKKGNSYSYSEQKARSSNLRKRENYALAQIQYYQKRLFKERNKRKQKNHERFRNEILKRQQEIAGTLLQIKDFPFADKMLDLNQVLEDIQSGKINFPDCAGKSAEKILREIHKKQWKALQKFQQKRSVIQ